jgi:hypothetical protein
MEYGTPGKQKFLCFPFIATNPDFAAPLRPI